MGGYSTTFDTDEAVLSEGGNWENNSPTEQFTKVTVAGGIAYGLHPNPNTTPDVYRDSYANCLAIGRVSNAWIRTTVNMGTVSGYMEIEHHHCFDEVDYGGGQKSPRGIEVFINPTPGIAYLQCAIWSGNNISGPATIDYFDVFFYQDTGLPTFADGGVFETRKIGTNIFCYWDGVLFATIDLTTASFDIPADGYPGIGFDAGGSTTTSDNWAFKDFATGEITMGHVVQKSSVGTAGSPAVFTTAPAIGNRIIVGILDFVGDETGQTITDSKGNTYQISTETVNPGDLDDTAAVGSALVLATEAGLTIDVTGFGDDAYLYQAVEVAGLEDTPLDVDVGFEQDYDGTSTDPIDNKVASGTLAQAEEFLFTAAVYAGRDFGDWGVTPIGTFDDVLVNDHNPQDYNGEYGVLGWRDTGVTTSEDYGFSVSDRGFGAAIRLQSFRYKSQLQDDFPGSNTSPIGSPWDGGGLNFVADLSQPLDLVSHALVAGPSGISRSVSYRGDSRNSYSQVVFGAIDADNNDSGPVIHAKDRAGNASFYYASIFWDGGTQWSAYIGRRDGGAWHDVYYTGASVVTPTIGMPLRLYRIGPTLYFDYYDGTDWVNLGSADDITFLDGYDGAFIGISGGGEDETTFTLWSNYDNIPSGSPGAMTGSIAVAFAQNGALSGQGTMAGAMAMVFGLTGLLSGKGAMAGAIGMVFSQSGALTGFGRMNGLMPMVFSTVSSLTGKGAIAGSISLAYNLTGALTGTGAMAGAIPIAFTQAGSLTDSNAGHMTGSIAVAFTTTAALTGNGAMAGNVAMAFTTTGLMTGGMSGSIAMAFTTTSTLTGTGAMAGSIGMVFATVGLFSGTGGMTGAIAMMFAESGTLTGTGSMTGSIPWAFTQVGALTGQGAMAGSIAMTFATTGGLGGAGNMTGSIALSFNMAGAPTGTGNMAGAIACIFATAGTLTTNAMTGSISMAFATAGAMTGAGALAGAIALTFDQAGALTDASTGVLVGDIQLTISVDGVLTGAYTIDADTQKVVGAFGSLTVYNDGNNRFFTI